MCRRRQTRPWWKATYVDKWKHLVLTTVNVRRWLYARGLTFEFRELARARELKRAARLRALGR